MEKADKVIRCIEVVKDLFMERMKLNHYTRHNDFLAFLLRIEKMYTRDMDLLSINRLKKRIVTLQAEDFDFVDLTILVARFKGLPFYDEVFAQVMSEKDSSINNNIVATHEDQVKIYKALIARLLTP